MVKIFYSLRSNVFSRDRNNIAFDFAVRGKFLSRTIFDVSRSGKKFFQTLLGFAKRGEEFRPSGTVTHRRYKIILFAGAHSQKALARARAFSKTRGQNARVAGSEPRRIPRERVGFCVG